MTTTSIDWDMVLSEIELKVYEFCKTKSLDKSDQTKWGDGYKEINEMKTWEFNHGVDHATQVFRTNLINKLKELGIYERK